MYERSVRDPEGFWSEIASGFYWEERWDEDRVCTSNLDARKGPINIEWFKGGRTNVCYNAIDRVVESGNGDKVAIYWEGNEPGNDDRLTYKELLGRVCQLSNYLRDAGIKKGDTVLIYLPMLMELPIAMLACARIGAVHSVVFSGYSADAVAHRILDCRPKLVITCNAANRGKKVINLKSVMDAALDESAKRGHVVGLCLTYENKLAMKKEATEWQEGRDIWWQDVVRNFPTDCALEWLDAEDPLFLLYTSGRSGQPKAVSNLTLR